MGQKDIQGGKPVLYSGLDGSSPARAGG